jgi:hypothetical protein
VGRLVETFPGTPAPSPSGFPLGVHFDRLERTQVDDDASVICAKSRGAVAASTHRQIDCRVLGNSYRGRSILGSSASEYGGRTAVDHPVMDPTSVLVVGVPRRDYLPCCLATKRFGDVLAHGLLPPFEPAKRVSLINQKIDNAWGPAPWARDDGVCQAQSLESLYMEMG